MTTTMAGPSSPLLEFLTVSRSQHLLSQVRWDCAADGHSHDIQTGWDSPNSTFLSGNRLGTDHHQLPIKAATSMSSDWGWDYKPD